jgi:hypothetical protein
MHVRPAVGTRKVILRPLFILATFHLKPSGILSQFIDGRCEAGHDPPGGSLTPISFGAEGIGQVAPASTPVLCYESRCAKRSLAKGAERDLIPNANDRAPIPVRKPHHFATDGSSGSESYREVVDYAFLRVQPRLTH